MAMITDPREILKREVASILDHPSVYMGGPSQGNLRRADRIIEHLESTGRLLLVKPPTAEAV